MTVTIVFADSVGGHLTSEYSDYDDARAGPATASGGALSTMNVGQRIPANYIVYETFLGFDTSAIADTDLVSAADLDLWLVTDNSTTDFVIRVKDRDWGLTLQQASDWVPGADLAAVTSVTATLNTSSWGVTGAYKTFTGTTLQNLPEMKSTDFVRLIVISDRTQTGTAPTASEYAIFSSPRETGTTQDPKLTITHAATTSKWPYTSRPFRVWHSRS